MKRFVLLLALMVGNLALTHAQDTIVLHIEDLPQEFIDLCIDDHQTVLVYAPTNCTDWYFSIDGYYYNMVSPIVITCPSGQHIYHVVFNGCDLFHEFHIVYLERRPPTPYTKDVLKRQGLAETLYSTEIDSLGGFDYLWTTGETTPTIDVVEPGVYTCEISALCGTSTRTFIVQDNVEATLATTDLATNLNMVTWQTTDEQAEYVSQVKVYRDGALVGTTPYADGVSIDNIGSEAASRTYTVLAVAPDGTDCPILSHPKETIHMTYTLGVGNTIVIGWNHPTGYDLAGYNICEWNPNAKDDGLTVIDYVGAGVSSYTCSESQFDHGMIVVQGVERTKDAESRLLSNRSLDYVGLGEKENKSFNLYPNPTTGRVTIEGTGRLTIMNTLGQTVLTRDITDTETIDLPSGVWFVKLDGATRKVVVE